MPFDFHVTPKTSRIMRRIRSQDTTPEVRLRKALWSRGIRGYVKYPDLPGKPDLLFKKARIIVFVDGCFWHGCPIHYRRPKKNIAYWSSKVERNIARDNKNKVILENEGYLVMRFWEHELTEDAGQVATVIKDAVDAIRVRKSRACEKGAIQKKHP